mmetsp:Transcript_4577/g.7943  ORF Transcript_4577/g.7943 Transcript_4577/m.7943 type:complete len:126 (-) Transcript_4577:342-719(-)|eukprot:CAMPEP_0196666292 /NCGR_PEP_ID=MMETSP1086-20130531/64431_1 /TAXON_ID=77921 /ORGANISM="Cyanoptyche  gloeocystis , Strain SAG4.97" /LENGTH=125 /DNA_ID=CAMNT_0042003463 /DNA_START=51 /DNA_END=428 /DNA_ORIENTATION=+
MAPMSSNRTAVPTFRQDMPPPGGYPSLSYKRNLPAAGPSAKWILLLGGAGIFAGLYRVATYNRERSAELEREGRGLSSIRAKIFYPNDSEITPQFRVYMNRIDLLNRINKQALENRAKQREGVQA